jgi:hypothetical protein
MMICEERSNINTYVKKEVISIHEVVLFGEVTCEKVWIESLMTCQYGLVIDTYQC